MRIDFNEIPAEGLRVNVDSSQWFPDQDFERTAAVAASVFLQRREGRVLLQGSIDTEIKLACDRCLDSLIYPLHAGFSLVLEVADEALSLAEKEHQCETTEMDTLIVDEPAVALDEILAQQVFLALPYKTLCVAECKGLCPTCGANLNKEPCRCAHEENNSPFNRLASLLKKE